MRRALIVLALIVGSCSSGPVGCEGNFAVCQRIRTLTDCGALQDEFNTADANHDVELDRGHVEAAKAATNYMEIALERMQQLDCTS